MAELRRGTVTFVFTDIEGSTRLARALRERWPDVRSEHRRLVRAAFHAHGGEEVDTQGDSFFYVFSRARDAALAAAEAQRALAAHDWPPGCDVRIRLGMHTAEPVVSDEGYHGIGVHRAARIMAAGHGGQVLMSEATAAVLADEEIAGLGVRDLGRHRLKDLERDEHVFQLVADGLEQQFPRLRTGEAPRPIHRRPLVIGAAAGVLAAAISIPVLAFAGGSGGEEALAAVDDNTVAMVDAESGELRAQAADIDAPQGVATGADAVWVSSAGGTIVRLDPKNHAVDETVDVGDGPQGVAVSGRDVWVANSLDGTVSRVSAETNREVEQYTVGNTPTGVAVGGGSVWITNAGDGTVTQLDAASGAVKKTIDVHAPVHGIAYGGGSIWVSDPVGNAVVRIRVAPSSASTRIPVGSGPTAIAYGGGRVWVANNLDGTVSRIEPATDIVSGTFPVGASPNGIAVTTKDVWVSDEVEGTLARVDPETGDADHSKLGGRPQGVGVSDRSVWVAVQAAGEAHRGGELRLLTPGIDFVDPALAYFPHTWNLLSLTGDGLVAFKRVGGIDGNTLVPNLATRLPQAADGGRTYAFQLRSGIRFSDGRDLRPTDVRATFERLFRAFAFDEHKTRVTSPRLDFYEGIVGGRACRAHPKTCDLSRGIVTNDADRTVTFHLERADPEFLHKLAVPFGYVVPEGTPVGRDRPAPGTGPYRFATYTPHRRAHLERNPQFRVWSRAAQPSGLVDTIDMSTNLAGGSGEPTGALAAFRATAADRVDASLYGPPAEALETARTRFPAQLHITPTAETQYILVNTRRSPFSNPLARRALEFALDRRRLVDLHGGSDLGGATCQLLSPGFPGYKPYCPYTARPEARTWSAPDLDRARAAVDRSGTRAARIRVITTDQNTTYRLLTEEVAATLRALGYRVLLKHYPTDDAFFNALFNDWRRVDAAVNGWLPDYPSPGAFFGALSCATNTYSCSAGLDRRMARAATAAQASGANAPWTQLDRDVANGAFVVPMFNPKASDFVSQRVGNYQRHPVFGMLLDQLWVR